LTQSAEIANRESEGGFRSPACDFRVPAILGILNITEDSFSDGGRYLAPDAALAQARKLVEAGASVVDIGAAASNPEGAAVPPAEEIARLAPVVEALKKDGVAVSIDSFSPEVQRWAVAGRVDWLNDIHGFPEPAVYPLLAASDAKLIVMHAVQERGCATRVAVDPADTIGRIFSFFERRITALEKAGVARSRLVLDPGMGFFLGDNPAASFCALRHLPELKKAFTLPILVSVSRKSFLRQATGRGPAEAGPATLAAELFAACQGADYIRTHDPGALKDGLAVWVAALSGNKT